MFLAKNNENIISAEKGTKKDKYICPACNQEVYLKSGKKISAHFAHRPNQACSSLFSEGETEEHLKGKKLILNWFEKNRYDVKMEHYIPFLQQRPDIMLFLKSGKNIAVEFQCSLMPTEKLHQRTEGYELIDTDVLWILGSNYIPQETKIKDSQYKFLTNINGRIGLPILDVNEEIISFFEPFNIKHNEVAWLRHKGELRENPTGFIDIQIERETELFSIQYYKEHYQKIDRQRRGQSDLYQSFFEYLYINRISFHELPNETLHILPYDYLIDAPSIFWKTIIINSINALKIGENFGLFGLIHAVKSQISHVDNQQIFLGEEVWWKPIINYLNFLISENYIIQDGFNLYRKTKNFQYYSSESEKLESIRRL